MSYIELTRPSWNLEFMQRLAYHAEKKFSVDRLRNNLLTKELSSVLQVLNKDNIYKFFAGVSFENLFLIDIASQEYKFAVLVRSENNCINLESKSKQNNPIFEIK